MVCLRATDYLPQNLRRSTNTVKTTSELAMHQVNVMAIMIVNENDGGDNENWNQTVATCQMEEGEGQLVPTTPSSSRI